MCSHSSAARQGPNNRFSLPIALGIRFLSEAASQAQSVAVGWTLYEQSREPLTLGIAGLVQFVPMLLLTLPAGDWCDRLSPRRVLIVGLALQGLCASAFLGLALLPAPHIWPFYLVLLALGAARACAEPAEQALLPFLVPPDRLPRAIALSSSAWQVAVIAGPALGGLAYALGAGLSYALCATAFLIATLGAMTLGAMTLGGPSPVFATATIRERIAGVVEGIAFVRSQQIVLGAISLDLVAVLLGGATALLPIYASDILQVGPIGLGLLRSAPAAGACLVALVQARHPPTRQVGRQLFAAVAVFGIGTLVFALSTSFMLSLAALFVLGASDIVSVNIRSSLIQLATPDALRGRVSAVNMLFVGASSELGAFESGLTAALFGTVPAVALGGIGTLLVVALWMRLFPALRRADRLDGLASNNPPSAA
jgi:MFS family permease